MISSAIATWTNRPLLTLRKVQGNLLWKWQSLNLLGEIGGWRRLIKACKVQQVATFASRSTTTTTPPGDAIKSNKSPPEGAEDGALLFSRFSSKSRRSTAGFGSGFGSDFLGDSWCWRCLFFWSSFFLSPFFLFLSPSLLCSTSLLQSLHPSDGGGHSHGLLLFLFSMPTSDQEIQGCLECHS